MSATAATRAVPPPTPGAAPHGDADRRGRDALPLPGGDAPTAGTGSAGPGTTAAYAGRREDRSDDAPGDAVARVTLQTVADRVGVSRMTVSNAFSRPNQLSAALREKILAAADELGYVGPDPAARALARGSSGAVGVLFTDSVGTAFRDPVAAAFFGALAEGLSEHGVAITLLPESKSTQHVAARDVAMDAALVYACPPHASAVQWLVRRRLPLVYVDQDPPEGVSSVLLDEEAGGRLAAEHVLALGHRRVALFTTNWARGGSGWADDPATAGVGVVARGRVDGAYAALSAAGAEVSAYEVYDNDERFVPDAARDLLAGDEPPTAVLCFSDLMAAAVIQAAADRGLRVPDDLSVVGFDDSVLARTTEPPLTTVRQDFDAKGRLASAALLAAIEHVRAGQPVEPTHARIPVELVVRESTGPAPS